MADPGTNKRKICLVTHLYPTDAKDYKGGFVRDLARALSLAGCEVHVVTPLRPGTNSFELDGPITIHRFFFLGWKKGIQLGQLKGTPIPMLASLLLSGIIKSIAVQRRFKLDIFHAYWIVPGGFIAVCSGFLTGTPVAATAAGSDLNIAASKKLISTIVRLTLFRLTKFIAVSSNLLKKAETLGLDLTKSTVIPGPIGIDLKKFNHPAYLRKSTRPEAERKNLLYAGNLTPPKRVDTIIKAAALAAEQGVDFQLTIIGSGEQHLFLEALSDKLNIKDRICFKGSLQHKEVLEMMQHSDIFLHCSENEGLPVAIMEAMASGLPVIAADVGGVSELVKTDQTGYTLDFDDAGAFAAKIVTLCKDDSTRVEMGRRARQFVEKNLCRNKIIAKNLAVYSEISRSAIAHNS